MDKELAELRKTLQEFKNRHKPRWRTCNECKALDYNGGCDNHCKTWYSCSLGYKMEEKTVPCKFDKTRTTLQHKPVGQCPKPLTWKNYWQLKHNRSTANWR